MLLSEAQIMELRSGIEAWHRKNPVVRAVPFIHFEDFAFATGATPAGTTSSGSIFSFLGIDPLSNLDPAVRELAQTRQLAERAVYYGQRAPKLISMEAQRLAFELAVTPESALLLENVDRVGGAAQTASTLAADLPRLFAEERSAAIEQLTGILDERQGQLQALVVELRSTLEAGGTTSDSVRETVAALDVLLARFDRPASATARSESRPFDVTEYTEALRVMGETAQQLQVLLGQADGKMPALNQASERATGQLVSLVDHVYWRLVQLILVLVAAGVVGALGYRAVVRRIRYDVMTAVQFRNPEVRLSEALATTRHAIEGHQVTLRELLLLVGEQGLLVFCAILAMPFLLPVSLPFMSTALGAPMLLIGYAVTMNRVPWLPDRRARSLVAECDGAARARASGEDIRSFRASRAAPACSG